MTLNDIWFAAIAVLFTGYFVLEGFDFGVGALLPYLPKEERERQVMIGAIGPGWDGDEVWLIAAGGVLLAAFPEWCATLFSGFYLPLLLILLALIVRGVAFEYRGKHNGRRWRRNWDRCLFWGSVVPAFLWGVVVGNIVRGIALDEKHEFVGTFWDLLNPFALLGGLTTLALFVTHGAVFLALKTRGRIRRKAKGVAEKSGVVAAVLAIAFLTWAQAMEGSFASVLLTVVAIGAWAAGMVANFFGREGRAFLGSAAALGAATISLFAALYPDVLPSTVGSENGLDIENAASTPKTLQIMTWVAVVFLPLVLLYQSWTYWAFRRRIGVRNVPASH
ncbi:cytochrome d ubiquinol oxidase subunit II [Herbidospora galbida]|uniref:Cytochrome d ubiquinol oxidase subunit II n=1 Tax=Herbidospora galbida TaxID=2575442 RepID=A0A4V5UZ11_9ACTN|nr:cytochrome d ubiquinol oxidase subunit II [Herbidospora galbida]TKK86943.1 cytochrome d ubiquinol oxidase subunit II [Herbidospora galbida]